MAAPKGNQFWKMRSSHGRNPIFDNPEQLWDAACQYFEWVENNPLIEDKVAFFQGVATHEPATKMRAMTLNGLLFFIDISDFAWLDYCKKEDFSGVTSRIKKVIYEQKFSGAAADLLNANIIARDLGLADKSELDHRSFDGSMSPKTAKSLSSDEIKAELEALGVKL